MEITETRKAIIEFIKPCMNKTLSEWCLYRFQDDDIKSMTKDEALNSSAFLESQEAWDTEIIWHYDITAVLKYLSINSNIEIILQDKICLIERWLDLEIENTYLKLLYKPIHLYTEEEDKNLLGLLKELWNLN